MIYEPFFDVVSPIFLLPTIAITFAFDSALPLITVTLSEIVFTIGIEGAVLSITLTVLLTLLFPAVSIA